MSNSDQAHLENLRRQYKRRLQLLENQAAQFGIYAPPHIQIEIEDINAKIAEINAQLGQTEAATPLSSSAPSTKLTGQYLNQFVDLLLKTQSMADRESREVIIRNLSPQIANSIARSSQPRVDVTNIVRTTLNYEGGLDELITQLKSFEGDSYPIRALDKFLRSVAA